MLTGKTSSLEYVSLYIILLHIFSGSSHWISSLWFLSFSERESLWKTQQKEILLRSMTKKENKLILYTDGGSRGNPGPAGCGVFITSLDSSITERRFKYLGIATNNIAEYMGGLLGIQRGIELGATEIELRADSKLMIEQLSGNYKVKNPELKKIWLQIHEMLSNW